MATEQKTVDYIQDQIARAGEITTRKMFGEYAVYCDTKIVALVCDDMLYVKPTEAGRKYLGTYTEKSPFDGAKPYLWIPGEQWDDTAWLTKLIRVTAAELPLPKPKAPKKKK